MAKNKIEDTIDRSRLPQHIAIIMDGNGRWANKRLLPRTMGHRAGMGALKNIVQACDELKIPFLTVFAFSTENWKRPVMEVDFLMRLLIEFLHKELAELHKKNVQIHVLGDYEAIPMECQIEIREALKLTQNNSGLVFNIALNYGARQEIIGAVKQLTEKIIQQEIKLEDINEEMFSQLLYTRAMPDPDLLIRTAGEMRISNFMLWQIAYAEIVVCDILWPDFSRVDLIKAIKEYQGRDRRFGGLSQ
ncbi:MAG: isoprenyl transferase [Firmicutes bacterium HGW-Firmicutes-15]|nr:MAG: isoprenyl transferase [Firmicutes bacterium HGW-Firmicutes-15]